MSSRNIQSARKSQSPAEYSSQHPACKQGAGCRLPLLFRVWSPRHLQDAPESFERPKDKMGQVIHQNPPISMNLLPSLKVSIAFTDLNPCSFVQTYKHSSYHGDQVYPIHVTALQAAPESSWLHLLPSFRQKICHLLSLFFPHRAEKPVSPLPTDHGSYEVTLKYNSSHRTQSPPAY